MRPRVNMNTTKVPPTQTQGLSDLSFMNNNNNQSHKRYQIQQNTRNNNDSVTLDHSNSSRLYNPSANSSRHNAISPRRAKIGPSANQKPTRYNLEISSERELSMQQHTQRSKTTYEVAGADQSPKGVHGSNLLGKNRSGNSSITPSIMLQDASTMSTRHTSKITTISQVTSKSHISKAVSTKDKRSNAHHFDIVRVDVPSSGSNKNYQSKK